jgi:uncharacterized protein YegL
MPKLIFDNQETITVPGSGNFQFSAVRIDDLDGATEYTLVTIIVDISGSVRGFAAKLLDCIKSIVKSCQKSPRSENLLIRLLTFNTKITEVHGFVNLKDINLDDYEDLQCGGLTALFDASYDGIGSTTEYARRLVEQEFDCNGAVYIITDGDDNSSTMTPQAIMEKKNLALQNEDIESILTILVGLHDPNMTWSNHIPAYLENFRKEAGFDQFVDVGEATEAKLAKLAGFVSQSISSQSQALGSGAPSQTLDF